MVTLLLNTLNEICVHAKTEFPDECCGVILQADSQEFVRPCRNIQNKMHKEDPNTYPRDARTAYLMHPDDLISVHKESDIENRPIKAFYHSHPNHEAYFSDKDKEDAMVWGEPTYPGVSYLVISIYEDNVRAIKAFEWDEKNSDFLEVPFKIPSSGETQLRSIKVRLTFPQEKITEPIIYTIGKQFGVITNIRRANVTEESGWVMLEMQGTSEELERAIDYLKNIKVQVEPVEGDVVQ
ncbi:hypothetical protein C6497_00060 [Candidatus Poribacteria bacterium]|nr:MAG: hypothetical protein C6497_00060 [Candidatus Poribacteria bacterium]